MDIKLAKDLDNRTDVLYFIADLIESAGIDETTAEKVADVMLEDNTRKQLRCAPALGAGCGEGHCDSKKSLWLDNTMNQFG